MNDSGARAAPLVGFKGHLRPEVVTGDAVYLIAERGVTALKGPGMETLAPLLDGTRDLPTLRRELAPGTPPERVERLVARLVEAGLVALRPAGTASAADGSAADGSAGDGRTAAFWELSGLDADIAASAVAAARVTLVTTGDVDGGPVLDAMTAAGLRVSAGPAGAPADLAVVLCDDYLTPGLADVDAAQRAANRPWLLAAPYGSRLWIGPVFQPPGSACWHCLAARQWGHRRAEAHVQAALGRVGRAARPAASVPPLAAAGAHLVAVEAAKWLAGYRYPGQHSVWTCDGLDLGGRHHEVRLRPQCPSCGDPGLVRAQARRPVRLAAREKRCRGAGGHRAAPPEEVLDRYRHLVSPVSGVVKEIRRDPRGPAGFNSYRSGPNFALAARGVEGLRAALRVENGGKGISALDAEVSALCEALERYCATFQGDEERIRGSLSSLGEPAVHPDSCQLYHERQYRDRAAWNAAHGPFQYVCDPFDPDAVLDWTPVWSLTAGRHRLVPTGLLYFGVPDDPPRHHLRADSNGNAAGTSIEDAILQALLELVERDAVALWWYNRTRQPAVDLDAFGDPWVDEQRQVYAELRRELWVLDVTSDVGIPTMVALSRRTDRLPEEVMFGFGAHLDPRLALRRALTELNQLMPALLDADRDNGYGCDDPDAVHWWTHATVDNQPYLAPDPAARPRTPDGYGYRSQPDLLRDVEDVRSRLDGLGLETLVLDQTRPDIGLPVVKVLVPGMRNFWARYAPGRLYDVPVRLGRRTEPVPYEELNPIPLFV